MEKLDFTAGSEKKFYDFIGKLGSERVALISHTDLDGIICARVINKVVDVNFMKFVGYQALDKNLVQELKNEKVKKVIFSDISVENILFLREIEKFADVFPSAEVRSGDFGRILAAKPIGVSPGKPAFARTTAECARIWG